MSPPVPAAPRPAPGLSDDELLRHSRHLLLDEIGIEGQARISAAHVLVIGAGGLGSPVALYLGSAGIGRLSLVDDDTVDLTNLQRQIAHTDARIGQPKVDSARAAVLALDPARQVHTYAQRADAAFLAEHVPTAQVVVDCSDNFATRQAVNAACVAAGVPLVVGAAISFDAQLMVVDPRPAAAGGPTQRTACYACVFPPEAPPPEVRCATMGVFAPLVGVIGSLQALEALKLVAGVGRSLAGRLLMLEARRLQFTEIGTAPRADCPVCGQPHARPHAHA